MLCKKFYLFFTVFVIFLFQSNVSAFDNQRKGFFASFGIGAGATYQESQCDWASGNRLRGNLTGSVKAGFAPSNRLLIHTSYTVAMLQPEEPLDFLLVVLGFHSHFLLGIGSSYYFKDDSPSFFFEGGVGPSYCRVQYKEETQPEPPEGDVSGLGFFAGIGYEFKKEASVQLQAMWLNTYNDKASYENQFDVVSIMLTLNAWFF